MTRRRATALLTALALCAACGPRELGLPRVALRVPSPDGARTAIVRNHPSIDPPRQSLWLEGADGRGTLLRRLGEDVDWCREAVWSEDGRRVAFLVQEAWVAVYDVDGAEVAAGDLVAREAYPSTTRAVDLHFVDRGTRLAFQECERATGAGCTPRTIPLGTLSL